MGQQRLRAAGAWGRSLGRPGLSIRPQPSEHQTHPAQMLGHARRGEDTRGREADAGARAALRGQMQGHADAGAREARRACEAHQRHVSFRRRCMLRPSKRGEGRCRGRRCRGTRGTERARGRCRGTRGAARAREGMRGVAAKRRGPARTARAGNRALMVHVVYER
jgi:hypothetical protein